MNFLKILSVMILTIAAIFIIVSFILPEKYNISSSVVIDEPQAITYDFVINSEKMIQWWPFTDNNSEENVTPVLSNSTTGSGIKWISNDIIKSGKMICFTNKPYDWITYTFKISDKKINALSRFTFNENDNKTTVEWTISGELPLFFRWMKFFNIYDIAEYMKKGLVKLKKETEKISGINLQIEGTEVPDDQMLIAIRDTLQENNLKDIKDAQTLSEYELLDFITKNNIELAGPPIKIIYFSDNQYIFDTAIPIIFKPNIKTYGRMRLMRRYGGPVILGIYHGLEKNIHYAYKILDDFMKKHHFEGYGYYWIENINNFPKLNQPQTINIYFPIYQ